VLDFLIGNLMRPAILAFVIGRTLREIALDVRGVLLFFEVLFEILERNGGLDFDRLLRLSGRPAFRRYWSAGAASTAGAAGVSGATGALVTLGAASFVAGATGWSFRNRGFGALRGHLIGQLLNFFGPLLGGFFARGGVGGSFAGLLFFFGLLLEIFERGIGEPSSLASLSSLMSIDQPVNLLASRALAPFLADRKRKRIVFDDGDGLRMRLRGGIDDRHA
jgi:hypothetical protein